MMIAIERKMNNQKMSPNSARLAGGRGNRLVSIEQTTSTGTSMRLAVASRSTTRLIMNNRRRIPSSSSSSSSESIISSKKYNINNNLKPIYSSKLAFLAIIVTFITILLLTCLANQPVSSLNCYTCSSADNPGCDESFSGRNNITDTDCEKQIGRPAKVCRKIVQYLENKKVVIRSCGWIDEHDDKKPMCYKRSGTFALMMESCICYEDNCNHSTSLVPNQSVSILLATVSMIFYYLISHNYSPNLHHHHPHQRDILH